MNAAHLVTATLPAAPARRGDVRFVNLPGITTLLLTGSLLLPTGRLTNG